MSMAQTTEERLSALEKRLADWEKTIDTLMLLAAKHPVGRQVLKFMAKANQQ